MWLQSVIRPPVSVVTLEFLAWYSASTGNSNGHFHRLRAPNPLLPLVCALGGGPHTPGRAHFQGAPVLPALPDTTPRHWSARGWPAYRQQAAAGRLLLGSD